MVMHARASGFDRKFIALGLEDVALVWEMLLLNFDLVALEIPG